MKEQQVEGWIEVKVDGRPQVRWKASRLIRVQQDGANSPKSTVMFRRLTMFC
jgi:hypothetical protein